VADGDCVEDGSTGGDRGVVVIMVMRAVETLSGIELMMRKR
jgi:hypothetical protein